MMGGLQSYSANNGIETINIVYQNKCVMISFDDIDSNVEDFEEGADED